MGKWTEVAKRYGPAVEEPGVWREQVNKIKDQAKGAMDVAAENPVALKNAYRKARAEKDKMDEAASKLNARIAALEELLAENAKAFERDVPYSFDDGARIEVSDQLSVKCADNDAVLGWVRKNGLERLLSINPGRLASLTKEAIENGTAVPDGVAITSYQQVKYVGPRKQR
jgi:phage host-nuclease inhibitor protein Gam